MDDFEKAEAEGRKIVEAILSGHCKAYEFTKEKYDHVDCYITGLSSTAVMEIKYRSAWTSTQIERMGGQMLEKGKYDALKGKKGYKPIFTVIYKDIVAMWDISSIKADDFKTEAKYPSSTMGKDKATTTKEVAYLDISKANTMKRNGKDKERDNSGT